MQRFLSFSFYSVIAIVSVWAVGGGLLTDVRLAVEGTVPAAAWRVGKVDCSNSSFVVSICSVRLVGGPELSAVSQLYVLAGNRQVPGDTSVVMGAESGAVSTSFGLQTIGERLAIFCVHFALLFWLLYVNTVHGGAAEAGLAYSAALGRSRAARVSQEADLVGRRAARVQSVEMAPHRCSPGAVRRPSGAQARASVRTATKRPGPRGLFS